VLFIYFQVVSPAIKSPRFFISIPTNNTLQLLNLINIKKHTHNNHYCTIILYPLHMIRYSRYARKKHT